MPNFPEMANSAQSISNKKQSYVNSKEKQKVKGQDQNEEQSTLAEKVGIKENEIKKDKDMDDGKGQDKDTDKGKNQDKDTGRGKSQDKATDKGISQDKDTDRGKSQDKDKDKRTSQVKDTDGGKTNKKEDVKKVSEQKESEKSLNLKVKEIKNEADFESNLKKAGDKLVVVDFYATWCGPCRMAAPRFERLAEEFMDVVFFKLDVDENEAVTNKYEVTQLPAFLFFKQGKVVQTVVGSNMERVEENVKKHSTGLPIVKKNASSSK